MTEQLAIDFTAREARDEGIRRAISHATKLDPVWREQALAHLRAFSLLHAYVMCEQVRAVAEAAGLPPPPDKRAWGQIMVDGKRAKLVTKLGYVTATDPRVHCNPVGYWKSLVYRGTP